MKDDRARFTVSRISANGLLEINRQRVKKALQLRSHRECPTCSGAGTIASPELVALNLLRRIETRAAAGRLKATRIELHPELADAFQNDRRQEIAALEREFDLRIEVIAATGLHRSEERVEWFHRPESERAKTDGDLIPAAVSAADLATAVDPARRSKRRSGSETAEPAEKTPAAEKQTAEEGEKKGRRRRRGGRRRKKAPKNGEANPSERQSESAPEPPAAADTNKTDAKPQKSRRRSRSSKKKKSDSSVPQPAPEPEAPSGRDPFAY
jgi:hypothetical protein